MSIFFINPVCDSVDQLVVGRSIGSVGKLVGQCIKNILPSDCLSLSDKIVHLKFSGETRNFLYDGDVQS